MSIQCALGSSFEYLKWRQLGVAELKAASNRAELDRHLENFKPGLIILDLRLGQDDGLDLLIDIRPHSDLPVIVITGRPPMKWTG
jgi:DNA-binding response OmpR family regulator